MEPVKEPVKAPVKAPVKVAPAPEPAGTPAVEAPKPKPKPAVKAKGKAKFTLQLSSFQDRDEAEDFHGKLTSSGYEPYITEANVPGKGLWYRVRLGRYVSHETAIGAKKDFEQREHIIAYVTRLK